MWISREIQAIVQKEARRRPAILLTGARQTGKSSLLERAFPRHDYVSLDWPDKAAEARESGAYFLEKRRPPLIIDEIQRAPELFRFLKIAIDKNRGRPGQYLLTGSQNFSLMRGVSESLSGRISILELHSLSAGEISARSKKAKKLSARQTLKWMIQGGYPEVHARRLDPERFYADYTATYLERDVRQLLNARDLSVFNKFLRLLALPLRPDSSNELSRCFRGDKPPHRKKLDIGFRGWRHCLPVKALLQQLRKAAHKISKAVFFGHRAFVFFGRAFQR